ncbi:DUF6090 family protein [Halocola ammonii]
MKIFHRIRKKLLAQGRIARYFTYALGEIVLVVIGILIALQINTWNQQRVENKEEIELLVGIRDEFENNLEELNQSIVVNNKVTEACVRLTQIIRTNTINNEPKRIDNLLISLSTFNSFDAQTGVSGEIVNSGKLSILKNDELRKQLVNWLTLLVDQEEDILFRSDNYTMNLMPFLMKRFPLANGELSKKLPFDKNNYLQTYKEQSPFKYNLSEDDLLEFENQIWHHEHNQDYVVINELNIRDFIDITIKMIDQELTNKKIE